MKKNIIIKKIHKIPFFVVESEWEREREYRQRENV